MSLELVVPCLVNNENPLLLKKTKDTWTLNIMRGKREDELRLESYPLARRKCYDYVKVLEKCSKGIDLKYLLK